MSDCHHIPSPSSYRVNVATMSSPQFNENIHFLDISSKLPGTPSSNTPHRIAR